MKTHLIKIIGLFILFQFLGVQSINSQDQKLKTKYKTWLVTAPENVLNNTDLPDNMPNEYRQLYNYKITEGHLYQLKDSTIHFAYSLNPSNPDFSKEIKIRNIESIKVRKKSRVLAGTLLGALSGLVLGGVIGAASANAEDACDSNLLFGCIDAIGKTSSGGAVGGFLGLVVGAGIGAVIGSIKVNVPINGKQSKYEEQKIKLQKYLIR
jgi:hypothetical protein